MHIYGMDLVWEQGASWKEYQKHKRQWDKDAAERDAVRRKNLKELDGL